MNGKELKCLYLSAREGKILQELWASESKTPVIFLRVLGVLRNCTDSLNSRQP
jgi:hypothetical protein